MGKTEEALATALDALKLLGEMAEKEAKRALRAGADLNEALTLCEKALAIRAAAKRTRERLGELARMAATLGAAAARAGAAE